MEVLTLQKTEKEIKGIVRISGSKSETNRLLILQQFYPNLQLKNSSISDDSKLLAKALANTSSTINVGHAGTAMRFLTAFYAVKKGSEVILTGSKRMKNRPIKLLVDALQQLGATISYVEKEGYPPLKIIGRKLDKKQVSISGNVSSQYISALMLIASSLPSGLTINLLGEVTSVPYINMTLRLLQSLGIEASFKEATITISPKKQIQNKTVVVESDWSSASYYYSLVALSKIGTQLQLVSYKNNSLQGDSCLAEIYKHFGVFTTFKENAITLIKQSKESKEALNLNLKNAPDIAQTIAVTCFGLKIPCYLKGLHTLKIKETDRLVALKTEIEKLGGEVEITMETLQLKAAKKIKKDITIATYEDHRMAMAFAPLALKTSLRIENPQVISKSYPNFWNHFNKIAYY